MSMDTPYAQVELPLPTSDKEIVKTIPINDLEKTCTKLRYDILYVDDDTIVLVPPYEVPKFPHGKIIGGNVVKLHIPPMKEYKELVETLEKIKKNRKKIVLN